MKIEINLNSFYSDILRKISEYSEIKSDDICAHLIKRFLEEIDTSICENLEENLGYSEFDGFTGRYID